MRGVRERRREIAGAAAHGAAARAQRTRQEIADGVEHDVGLGARLHQPDARLAHRHLRLAGHGQHREIEIVEPPSRTGDEIAGLEIGAARQHAVTGGGRRDRFEAPATSDDRVERHDRIRAGRQRVADVDTTGAAASGAGAYEPASAMSSARTA